MLLSEVVKVDGRYQRSVNIQLDGSDAEFFKGYKAPKSSEYVLEQTCLQSSQNNQNAFTWTGPYGSGKSSLALALCSMVKGDQSISSLVASSFSNGFVDNIIKNIAPNSGKRRCINIVGRAENPENVLREILSNFADENSSDAHSSSVMSLIQNIFSQNIDDDDGIILFVDEMGKLLEAAAKGNGDVYLFQEIAELANRSNGRMIFIGVLHQSFAEYAGRLSQEMKREWSKIEGRYVDIALNVSGEEQIELISRALQVSSKVPSIPETKVVANEVAARRPATSKNLYELLSLCWPLHPSVTSLLGPLSRRSYGQNQRSLFGFLNTREPSSFQEFLENHEDCSLFLPNMLWDYLKHNLDASIFHSPDGHKWATHSEAVDRCISAFDDPRYVSLLKSISVLDLFKEQSGVYPSLDVLNTTRLFNEKNQLQKALKELEDNSLIVFRAFSDAYSIFAGSDFDIESEVAKEIVNVLDGEAEELLEFQPIMAKRHYHQTGTNRWFSIKLIGQNSNLKSILNEITNSGYAGVFLLSNNKEEVSIQDENNVPAIVFGHTEISADLLSLAKEILALKNIAKHNSKLLGDEVARREVDERIAFLNFEIADKKDLLISNANWHFLGTSLGRLKPSELNKLASKISDELYSSAVFLKNELLNRKKPSSTARGAQNELIRRILSKQDEPNLGMTSYSADRGLFESLLVDGGIYQQNLGLVDPREAKETCKYTDLWIATDNYLKDRETTSVKFTDIYSFWSSVPFGISDGLHTLLMVLYCETSKNNLVIYRDELFIPEFSESDGLLVANNPKTYSLKWLELDANAKEFMMGIAHIVTEQDADIVMSELTPLEVGKAIISWFDALHPLTHRTLRLTKDAIKIRDILKNANDPTKLIFSDLREFSGNARGTKKLANIIAELSEAYPEKINKLKQVMLDALGIHSEQELAFKELQERATNIRGLKDKSNLGPFILKLTSFDGQFKDSEFLASYASGKPTPMWYDGDFDKAQIGLVELSNEFNKLEAFAFLENRVAKRQSITVLQSSKAGITITADFDVLDKDEDSIEKLAKSIDQVIEESSSKDVNVIMSALTRITEKIINNSSQKPDETEG